MSSSIFINGVAYPENKVRYIPCSRWDDFTKEIRKVRSLRVNENLDETGSGVMYRGHANIDCEWKLSSTLERAFYASNGIFDHTGAPVKPNFKQIANVGYDGVSKDILNKFKLLAAGKVGMDLEKSDDELWSLGRHYGLLTPLLDWTESPYIAAFFAFIEILKSLQFKKVPPPPRFEYDKVHIWGLRRWSKLEVTGEFEIVSLPKPFGSRLWAQAGLFTKLISKDHLDIQSYLESRGLAHYLECYQLPYYSANAALPDLKMMNITHSKVFPDLFGAAEEANIIEQQFLAFQMQTQIYENDRPNRDSV